jgi:hypothetical protein
MVLKYLLSKHKDLSSNHSTALKKKGLELCDAYWQYIRKQGGCLANSGISTSGWKLDPT